MPTEPPTPTDNDRELAMGRIALWLNPDDLEWLGSACRCAEDADEETRDRCARVRFRAQAALHKAGYKMPTDPLTPRTWG